MYIYIHINVYINVHVNVYIYIRVSSSRYINYDTVNSEQLWTAPEILRLASRPLGGTPKGDVYSFAIICQEIVYRNGVFYCGELDYTPQGKL